MTKKAIINIVYAPQTGAPNKAFENDKGEIWRSAKYDNNKINIGMGWYSIRNPKPQDSIWVIEPFCVLEKDYEYKFVKHFKYIFTWATKAFTHKNIGDKVVKLNHPSYHHFAQPQKQMQSWVNWQNKNNEIVFIANNKSSRHHSELYSLRLQLADILHKKSKLKVSWYAQIPIKRPYYKGSIKSKQEAIKKAKFSVCTENSYDPIYTYGYFTEKMPDVWMSGTIPIYMGCHNIDDFNFPKNSYLDLRNFVKKSGKKFIINEQGLINHIESFSEQKYNNWITSIKNNIIIPQRLKQIASFSQTYEAIINKFHKDMLKGK